MVEIMFVRLAARSGMSLVAITIRCKRCAVSVLSATDTWRMPLPKNSPWTHLNGRSDEIPAAIMQLSIWRQEVSPFVSGKQGNYDLEWLKNKQTSIELPQEQSSELCKLVQEIENSNEGKQELETIFSEGTSSRIRRVAKQEIASRVFGRKIGTVSLKIKEKMVSFKAIFVFNSKMYFSRFSFTSLISLCFDHSMLLVPLYIHMPYAH